MLAKHAGSSCVGSKQASVWDQAPGSSRGVWSFMDAQDRGRIWKQPSTRDND